VGVTANFHGRLVGYAAVPLGSGNSYAPPTTYVYLKPYLASGLYRSVYGDTPVFS
jgi:hypothetical protein